MTATEQRIAEERQTMSMKTADQWHDELAKKGSLVLIADIRAIQSDARRAAFTEAAGISRNFRISGMDGFAAKDAIRDAILAARDKRKGGGE